MTKTAKKELIFGEGLLQPVLCGKKHITIRKYRPEAHNIMNGERFLGVFKDGFNLELIATADRILKTFNELTDDEAVEDGFFGAIEAFDGMKAYYPDLEGTDTIAVIRFNRASCLVRRNKYYRDK
jgi:hypothetical protein